MGVGVRRRCPNDGDELEESGCEGMMVLDRESHPNWKLCCNKCNKIIRFTANIHDIQVLKTHCEGCNASLVKVVFNKLNSPLPDGQLEYTGCIMCDDFLNGIIELVSGRNKHVKLVHRRGRGRGRGRRGGNRGRGRGGKRSVFDDMYSCFQHTRNINDKLMQSLFVAVSDNITNVLERVQSLDKRLRCALAYIMTETPGSKPVV